MLVSKTTEKQKFMDDYINYLQTNYTELEKIKFGDLYKAIQKLENELEKIRFDIEDSKNEEDSVIEIFYSIYEDGILLEENFRIIADDYITNVYQH